MSWNQLTPVMKRGWYGIVLCFCLFCVYGCSIPNFDLSSRGLPDFDIDIPGLGDFGTQLEEVSPPELVQQLKTELSDSNPNIKILEPREGATLETQNVEVTLSVSDFKTYKDADLGLGPHIAVFVDNQPPIEIYSKVNQPISLQGLQPGTHSIRAIAEYPWHESFKNQSAYAQRSFNILTTSQTNNPGTSPILTVSSIQDSYTAEPILVDFVIKQAQANSNPDTERKIITPKTVKVKASLNDQSFVIEEADSSLFLQGLKNGQNWLKLEIEEPSGQANSFREQTFGFQFQPEASSPLGNIFAEKISKLDAGGIIGHPKPAPVKVIPSTPTSSISAPKVSDPSVSEKTETKNVEPKPTPIEMKSAQPSSDRVKNIKPNTTPEVKTTPNKIERNAIPSQPKTQTTAEKTLPSSPQKRTPKVEPKTANTPTPIKAQESEKPKATAFKTVPKAEKPISSPSRDRIKTSSSNPISKNSQAPQLPSRVESTAGSPATSTTSIKEQTTPNQTPVSVAPKKPEPTPNVKKTTENPNQLNNQFQALRKSSQDKATQGLQNWRDRFRDIKSEAVTQSKRTIEDGSSSISSTQTPPSTNGNPEIKATPIKP